MDKVWYLFQSEKKEKKKKKNTFRKTKMRLSPLLRLAKLQIHFLFMQFLQLCNGIKCWNYYNISNSRTNREGIF